MIQRRPENVSFDSTNILLFLYKWRKPLLWVVVLSIVGSTIVSLTIDDKYRSTVIMYPAATNAISQALLTQNRGSIQKGILDFGVDEETEQMLQILNSNRIRDCIIEEFGLESHYNINPKTKYRLTKLHRRYENNISFKRTEFMAVKISVLDTDPLYAANIANRIADLLDSTKSQIQQERAKKAFEIVKGQYFNLLSEMQQMEDSLTKLRELGINDYESQSEMINQQMVREMAANNTEGIRRLQQELEILAKYGGPYVALRDQLEFDREKLSLLKSKYEEARTDAEEVLPTKFVVNSAFPAERKFYPIRWLIVLVSAFSAFLFTLIISLIIESIGEYFPNGQKSNSDSKFKSLINSKKESTYSDNKFDRQKQKLHFKSSDQPLKTEVIKKDEVSLGQDELIPIVTINKNDYSKHKNMTKTFDNQSSSSNFRQTQKSENQMEKYFVNTNLLKLFFKWRIHLSVIVLLSLIISLIISSPIFIEPKFRSTAIMYPSNLSPYSDENETEQMLQLLDSRDIVDSIIARFNLIEYYDIDPFDKQKTSKTFSEFRRNVFVSTTKFESVKIDITDKDPQIACDMVNSMIEFYNKKVNAAHRKKYHEILVLEELRLTEKKMQLDSLMDIIIDLRLKYGLIDYGIQSNEVMRGYLGTFDGSGSAQVNRSEIQKLKSNIESRGDSLLLVTNLLTSVTHAYNNYLVSYEDALRNVNKELTFSTVVTNPFPADKKCYPVRWIIILVSGLGAFLMASTMFLVIDIVELNSKL